MVWWWPCFWPCLRLRAAEMVKEGRLPDGTRGRNSGKGRLTSGRPRQVVHMRCGMESNGKTAGAEAFQGHEVEKESTRMRLAVADLTLQRAGHLLSTVQGRRAGRGTCRGSTARRAAALEGVTTSSTAHLRALLCRRTLRSSIAAVFARFSSICALAGTRLPPAARAADLSLNVIHFGCQKTRTSARNITHNLPPALRPPCLSSALTPACPATAATRPARLALGSTMPLPASVEGQLMTMCTLRCGDQLISAYTSIQHRLRRHTPGLGRSARRHRRCLQRRHLRRR